MKHTKRLTSAILAAVMTLSLLIPAAVLPTAAEETADLSKKLYLHYDFNDADPTLAVKDKAPTVAQGGISAAADDLEISGSSIGSAAAPGTQWAVAPNFQFDGFSARQLDRRAALRSGESADLKAVQTAGTASTWFVRFKMDGFVSTADSATPVHFGSYSANSVPDKDAKKVAKPFVVTVNKSNLQMNHYGQQSTVKAFWEPGEWLNVSLVRTYNQATNDYTYLYTVYNDALQVVATHTMTGVLDTYQNEEVFLFRSPDGSGFASTESWSGDTGLSLDDVRCYGVALTQAQIQSIISTEFASVDAVKDNLLMHYDFEGADLDEMLSDKSYGTSAAGTVADNMILSNRTEGFSIHEGVIKAGVTNFGMYIENSADVNKAQTDAESTWFLRFKTPGVAANQQQILIDYRNTASTSTRPMYMELTTNNQPTSYFNQTGVPVVYDSTAAWARDEWVNMAIVRTKASNGNYFINVYNISDDGVLMPVYKTLAIGSTVQQGTHVAFFRHFVDATKAFDYGNSASLSYDDIRCYNTALAPHQLSQLVAENFGENVGANVINTGVQIGNGTVASTDRVRLIAQIKGDDYSAAGFKVTATWDGQTAPVSVDLSATCAYSSILMEKLYSTDSAKAIYYPDEGYYLLAVIIDNIPKDRANLKLTFTPYAVDAAGETEYAGQTFTYNVSTGAYEA